MRNIYNVRMSVLFQRSQYQFHWYKWKQNPFVGRTSRTNSHIGRFFICKLPSARFDPLPGLPRLLHLYLCYTLLYVRALQKHITPKPERLFLSFPVRTPIFIRYISSVARPQVNSDRDSEFSEISQFCIIDHLMILTRSMIQQGLRNFLFYRPRTGILI